MKDIQDRLRRVIAEHLDIDEARVAPTASFVDDLGRDSLTAHELVIGFEGELGVQIPSALSADIRALDDCGRPH